MLLETTIKKADADGLMKLQGILLNTVNFYQEVYQFQFPTVAMIFGENWEYLAWVIHSASLDETLSHSRVETVSFLSVEARVTVEQLIETSSIYFQGIDCVALLPIGSVRQEETKQLGRVLASVGSDFHLIDYTGQLFKVFNTIPELPIIYPRVIDPRLPRTH